MIKSTLTYSGRAKYPFTADSDWSAASPPDAPEPREATGWEYNTETALYNANGTPKTGISKATLEEEGDGPRFYFGTKGAALYSVQYPLQRIVCDGTGEFLCSYLAGTETVDSKQGTTTLTVAAGKITATAGTLWSFTLPNGSRYEYATKLDSARAIVFDISGNDRHLILSGFADLDATCVSGGSGSDWINQGGSTVSNGNYWIDDISFGNIPNGIVIPALADGSGCAAYEVV